MVLDLCHLKWYINTKLEDTDDAYVLDLCHLKWY